MFLQQECFKKLSILWNSKLLLHEASSISNKSRYVHLQYILQAKKAPLG